MSTTSSAPALSLHPDRLLPSEPGARSIAQRLYGAVADLPIVSPHGHVPAEWLAERDAIIESIKIGDSRSINERRELSR